MATLAIVASIAIGAPAQAGAAPTQVSAAASYERGPYPTEASITAVTGPFATATVNVPSGSGPGFNNGTIYYPTDTSQGTFGSVVVMPGFFASQSQIAWYGPRLASQGFVVLTLDSNAPWDPPGDRGSQLLAALDYLTTQSAVKNRIDPTRSALIGWSMGGGGTLESAANRPALKAAIPLAPWNVKNVGAQIKVPTMIFGADGDTVAPVSSMSLPYYNAIVAPNKAFINLKGADHFTFAKPTTTIAKYSIAWLKRFVDSDTRYNQFLCPAPNDPTTVDFKITCPV